MHKERSGSLGSTPIRPLFLQPGSNNPSDEQVNVSDAETLEDARKLIRDLRAKTRQQAQQIMAWRRAYKMQDLFISRLQREKCDQLKAISSKLLLFESRLIRKQKDIQSMLQCRENLIFKQQRIIESLTSRLTDNGLEVPQNDITDIEYTFPDLESLNDSDSAVVMEDADYEGAYRVPTFRGMTSDGITVMRSISDAIDPNLKYTSRRSNGGFLRRPEILETVYSVEEDADNDQKDEKTDVRQRRESFAMRGKSNCNVDSHEENGNSSEGVKKKSSEEKCGEKLAVDGSQRPNEHHHTEHQPEDDNERYKDEPTNAKPNPNQVKTYNRVMSNHRSVTKPKDVKYKRINKAKSKSLEELRGRLKNWVDQGGKMPGIALEHSQSYA